MSFRVPAFWVLSVALILTGVLTVMTLIPGAVLFNLDDEKSVTDALLTLLVAALFVERVQEVFIAAWRKSDRARIEAELEDARNDLRDTDTIDLKTKLTEYRAQTQKLAFALGLAIGFLVAFAGVRSISQVVNYEHIYGFQLTLFNIADVAITAGVIAGGSDALHQLMSLFTDTLETTRNRVRRSG